jgi:hypothetical protein
MLNFTHYSNSAAQDDFSPAKLISSTSSTGSHVHGTNHYDTLIPDVFQIVPADNRMALAAYHIDACVLGKADLLLRQGQ